MAPSNMPDIDAKVVCHHILKDFAESYGAGKTQSWQREKVNNIRGG